jgi:hypothetical protein
VEALLNRALKTCVPVTDTLDTDSLPTRARDPPETATAVTAVAVGVAPATPPTSWALPARLTLAPPETPLE